MEENKALFSERIAGGARTYFFDVRKTKTGSLYLVINESKPKDDGFESTRIMVFENHLADFQAGLNKALEFIQSRPKAAKATASGSDR
jgi:hypothetical protein